MKLPTQPLGKNRKRLALCVILLAIGTFFSPMVILDPPLLGQAEWTPLRIARNVYERKLPVSGGHLDEHLIGIGLIYALIPFVLVAVYRPGPPRMLAVISTIGFIPSFLGKFWHHAFMYTFGWEYFEAGHLRRGPAQPSQKRCSDVSRCSFEHSPIVLFTRLHCRTARFGITNAVQAEGFETFFAQLHQNRALTMKCTKHSVTPVDS